MYNLLIPMTTPWVGAKIARLPPLTEKTEAQRGDGSCLRSHSPDSQHRRPGPGGTAVPYDFLIPELQKPTSKTRPIYLTFISLSASGRRKGVEPGQGREGRRRETADRRAREGRGGQGRGREEECQGAAGPPEVHGAPAAAEIYTCSWLIYRLCVRS